MHVYCLDSFPHIEISQIATEGLLIRLRLCNDIGKGCLLP